MSNKKLRMKKGRLAIFIGAVLAVVLAIVLIVNSNSKSDTADGNDQQTEPEQGIIADETGGLEIVVPAEQGTFGE